MRSSCRRSGGLRCPRGRRRAYNRGIRCVSYGSARAVRCRTKAWGGSFGNDGRLSGRGRGTGFGGEEGFERAALDIARDEGIADVMGKDQRDAAVAYFLVLAHMAQQV